MIRLARCLRVVCLAVALAWTQTAVVHGAAPVRLNGLLTAGGDVNRFDLQFSPDGSRVLYLADQTTDEVFEIFSVPSNGGTPIKLNAPMVSGRDVSPPFQFSPDGSQVLYHADQLTDDVFEIFTVPSAGGTPIRLNTPLTISRNVFGPGSQFSPDGSRVLYLADQTNDEAYELFSVPSAGGTPVRLSAPLGSTGDVSSGYLQFSPDGSRVLYTADQTTDEAFEIFSVPSTGGTPVRLNAPLVAGGFVWDYGSQFSPDGSRVLYWADQNTDDVFEIFSVPSTGGTPVRLNAPLVAGGDVFGGGLRFSPDGSRVLYAADQTTDDVVEAFIVPSTGGTPVRLNAPLVAGGDVSSDFGLQLSPDGGRVLYHADQTTDDVFEIFSVPAAGGTPIKLNASLIDGGDVVYYGLQFSPDSSHVLYLADQTTNDVVELFSVPSTGGTPVKLNAPLVSGGDVHHFGLQFSPDGSRVLYWADQMTDEVFEIFSVPTTGGIPVKINAPLVAGGDVSEPGFQFSPDGSRVLYHADQTADELFEIFARVVRVRWSTAGGSWDTAANWDQTVVPDDVIQVIIDRPAVVTVTGGATPRVVNEVRLGGGSDTSVLELRSDAVISAINGFSILPRGVLRGDGVVDTGSAQLTNSVGGEIRVGSGERLRISSAAFANPGRIETIGTTAALAELEFSGAVTNASETGTISGRNAILRFNGGLTNQGSMAFSLGTTDVLGNINNVANGRIVVSGRGTATFYDDVVNNGQIQVSTGSTAVYFGAVSGPGSFPGGGTNFFEGDLRPGASPEISPFEGDVEFGNTATLEIEIGGDMPGDEHDQVQVGGNLTLAGTLELVRINNFVPSPGDRFTIMTFGSRVGTFQTVTGTSISPTLAFHPLYSATDLTLITTNPTEKTWGVDAGGAASVGANWIGGVAPTGLNEAVAFTTAISANRTVQVDTPVFVRLLRFDDDNNYTIAGPQAITLSALEPDAAAIIVEDAHGDGEHRIDAPLVLASDLVIVQQSSQALAIGGALNNPAGRTISVSGSGATILFGAQIHGSGALLIVDEGSLTLASNAGSAAARNLTVEANSTTNFGSTQHLAGLSVGEGATATLTPGGNKVLVSNVPTIAGATGAWTGTIDLTDNDEIAQSSAATKAADFARMYDQLKSGFAGGVWTGTGITSSTAATNPTADTGLSLVDNALLGASDFSGQPVNNDSLLLKYTYYGDIDLNGRVDGDDLTTFALNFGRTTGATQVDGDIDFNGTVDGEDLTVFANNFNKGIGSPLAAGAVAAVPEPASLVLAGLGALGILLRVATRRDKWHSDYGGSP